MDTILLAIIAGTLLVWFIVDATKDLPSEPKLLNSFAGLLVIIVAIVSAMILGVGWLVDGVLPF